VIPGVYGLKPGCNLIVIKGMGIDVPIKKLWFCCGSKKYCVLNGLNHLKMKRGKTNFS